MPELNPTRIRHLIKAGRDGMHADRDGLYLRITNGNARWDFRYTDPVTGKRTKHRLGPLPAMNLGEAREKTAECRKVLLGGKDPKLERTKAYYEEVRTRSITKTVDEVIADYIDNKKDSVGAGFLKNLKRHLAIVSRAIGKMPIEQVTPLIIAKNVGDICIGRRAGRQGVYKTVGLRALWQQRQSGQEFQRVVEDLFKHAISFGWRTTANPATTTVLRLPENPHRTEHRKEVPLKHVPLVLEALHTYRYLGGLHAGRMNGKRPILARLVEFICRSGVRTGEARQAQWKEIDLKRRLWTVPAAHRKLKFKYKTDPRNTHEVPLTDGMIAVLSGLKADGYDTSPEALIFPNQNGRVFDAAVMGDFVRKHLQRYIREGYGVDLVFHVHGIRSSLADWWRPKATPALWRLQVGQRPGGRDDFTFAGSATKAENAYGHSQLTEDRRPIMEEWDTFCSDFSPTSVMKISDYRIKRRRAA